MSNDSEHGGGVDVDDGRQAFLGGNAHWCDICKRPFQSLARLIKHDCEPTGAATTLRGPEPASFEAWGESR